MPETKDYVASGLSLTPADENHVSALLRQVNEAIGQLQSGQREPWFTTLRDAAEQREDLAAARSACHCLSMYYGGFLAGADREEPDHNRALYYAQTIKDCGPESQGLYHAVYGAALLNQANDQEEYSRDDLAPAAEHLYTSIQAGNAFGAEFVVNNCEIFKMIRRGVYGRCTFERLYGLVEYWGLVYAAYQFFAHDPDLTPLQQEENASKATTLLQEVQEIFKEYSWQTDTDMTRETQDYPRQARIALDSQPSQEDAASIRRIQQLVTAQAGKAKAASISDFLHTWAPILIIIASIIGWILLNR